MTKEWFNLKQIKPNNEIHKEINDELITALKESPLKDNLIKLKKEVALGKNFTDKKDIKKYQEKCEELLLKINKNIDKITNLYNENYTRQIGADVFDINIYNQLDFKKFKDGFVLTYFDRLPKDSKNNFKSSAGMFSAICYKIQEYIDKHNLYPKPAFKKSHIVFETVYDTDSKQFIWDNDHISRFYISDILNALVFVGIINSDEGLDTSFEIRSNMKKLSQNTRKKIIGNDKKKCVAYTKIHIIPEKM